MNLKMNGTILEKALDVPENLVLPENITKVQPHAFFSSKIQSVSFPDGIEIDNNAFLFCEKLERIIFQGDKIQLGRSSFPGPSSQHLKQVIASESFIEKIKYCFPEGTPFFTPDGKEITFKSEVLIKNNTMRSSCWLPETYSVPEEVTHISFKAINNSPTLRELFVPDSVRKIDRNSIFYCPKLETISFPPAAEIDFQAIDGCPGLTTLIFRGNETVLDSSPVHKCPALKKIISSEQMMKKIYTYFPSKVKFFTEDGTPLPTPVQLQAEEKKMTIKKASASAAKKSATDITLLESIDKSASVIHLPEGLKVIPAETFKDCVNLKKIILSEDVTTIEARAFSGCVALEQLAFKGKVTSIASTAFQKCKAIQSVVADTGTAKLLKAIIKASSVTFLTVPKAKTDFEKQIFPEIEKKISLCELLLWAGDTKSKITYANDGKPASEILLAYIRYAYASQVQELPDCNKNNYFDLTVPLEKAELADRIANALDKESLLATLEKLLPACCFEYHNDSWKFKKETKDVFAGEALIALLKKARNMANKETMSTVYDSCIIINSPADVIPYIRYAPAEKLDSIKQSFSLWGDSSLFSASKASRNNSMELSAVAKGGRQSVALALSAMPLNDHFHPETAIDAGSFIFETEF